MPARLVHGPDLNRYSFGEHHPMGPGRVELTLALADQLGVLQHLEVVPPPPVEPELLRAVHDDAYIAAVQAERVAQVFGIGTTDNPLVVGMHDIASGVCAATVEAARSVWSGEVDRAVNIAGGLHHAMPTGTSGFCVYNDLAVAIRWLQSAGCRRIAYLDIDAHHGDGVQQVFWDDPGVLTVSIHESPVHLFPGTGFAHETGGAGAEGTAVNIALPPGTSDREWLRAFDAIVPPVLEAFAPEVLVTQHGCDAHLADPLTDLELSMDGLAASYRMVEQLAERYAGGRWIATGGGGYAMPWVLPRAWTHLLAVLAGRPVDPATPMPREWLTDPWRDAKHGSPPATMGDGVDVDFEGIEGGYDPASRIDQAILATRKAVFPEHGLDPDVY